MVCEDSTITGAAQAIHIAGDRVSARPSVDRRFERAYNFDVARAGPERPLAARE